MGDIRIIQETAEEYEEIGHMLLNDREGLRVDEIKEDKGDEVATVKEIYKKWLIEEQYASWATLCDVFRRKHLNTLAHRIEEYFKQSASPGICRFNVCS